MNLGLNLGLSSALVALSLLGASACESDDLAADIEQSTASTSAVKDSFGRRVIEQYFTGADGKPVRVKIYKAKKEDGFVLFLQGFGEFIEKYDVLFSSWHEFPAGKVPATQTLADLPLTFVTMDSEGQGKSVEGRVPGHIDDFNNWVEDARSILAIMEGQGNPNRPKFVMAHSTGGLIAARVAELYPALVDGLILSSPLFGLQLPPGVTIEQVRAVVSAYATPAPGGFGFANRCSSAPQAPFPTLGALAQCLGDSACAACFADPASATCASFPSVDFAALRSAYSFLQTSGSIGCPVAYDPAHQCALGDPAFFGTTTDFAYCSYSLTHPLAIGSQTLGWYNQVFGALDALNAGLPALTMPTLVLSSPDDPITKPLDHARICELLPACTLKQYPASGSTLFLHELLAETRRDMPLADIRSFITAQLSRP